MLWTDYYTTVALRLLQYITQSISIIISLCHNVSLQIPMQYSQDIVMTHQSSSIFYHILLCLLLTKKINTMELAYIYSQIENYFLNYTKRDTRDTLKNLRASK